MSVNQQRNSTEYFVNILEETTVEAELANMKQTPQRKVYILIILALLNLLVQALHIFINVL